MDALLKRPQTMMDVYRLLPEGTPIQLINNSFNMSPAPLFKHFEACKNIYDVMNDFIKSNDHGIVCFAPLDVFFGISNAVQPDVFFIAKENRHIIKEDGVYGAPDIIVEVLSPGDKNANLVKKKVVYEQFGVKEYFIVEPADASVITWFFKQGKYAEQKKQKGKLVSKLLKKSFSF
jgi:Uma2 family endonuclease